ncbi:multidrug ABC transporter permease [Lottiidibacillus patelloidae]|uniref:Multidrug ABC transporter permease n=2 Tax=Lottiidibacillus patelloidae TaxID=2670334 RepID=A0A263BR73_9BACI|nr:multidrug ABC transporter permease [Lottiidibacillus patelloidae]
MLTVAVAAELTGPFIAKKMIDDNILGIENPWYETTSSDSDTVTYEGTTYKRGDRFLAGEEKGTLIQILQVKRSYYIVNEKVQFDGSRSYDNGKITITSGEKTATYSAEKLSGTELFNFYRPEIDNIIFLLAIYVGLLVFASFFQYGKSVLLQTAANRIIQKMRKDVFAQIQRVPINYFDNRPAGKIVARITNDTEAIRELYVKVLETFFTSTIYMTGIYIALFLLDVKLALITTLLIPIMIIWFILYRKYASHFNHMIRTRVSDLNGIINESIQGMPIIHAFLRKKETKEEFEKLNHEHYSYQNRLLNLNALTSHNLVFALRNVAFVALIWYFGGKSLEATTIISVGVLYAFVDYLNRLFQPVTEVVNQLAQLEQARVASERVFELLDAEGEDVKEGTMPRYDGNVSFNNVSFAYKDDEYVLKNISFEAKKGETVALVGHTGSGKSSIMNLLFRFYDPQKGSILVDGKEVTSMPKQHLRKHMGIVLQDPFLFTGTIASNVTLQDPSITKEIMEKALRDVGAEDFIKRLPKGYDEPVIEKGSTLSAGQRQLISFARALAFNPAILILDEATASIDTETEAIIQDALEVLKKGRTTFIIAHRLSTIKNADQILVLDKGKIVERGTHDELLEHGGKYYQMYEMQQGKQVNAV